MVILKRLFAFSVVFVLFLFSDPASAAFNMFDSQDSHTSNNAINNDTTHGFRYDNAYAFYLNSFAVKSNSPHTGAQIVGCLSDQYAARGKCIATSTNVITQDDAVADEWANLILYFDNVFIATSSNYYFLLYRDFGSGGASAFKFNNTDLKPATYLVTGGSEYTGFDMTFRIFANCPEGPECPECPPANECDYSTTTDVFLDEWLSYDDIGKETRITYDKDGSHYVAINKPFNLYLFFYSLIFSLMVIIFFFYYK